MLGSRGVQIGVALVVVALVLSALATTTTMPGWLIVVLYAVAAVVAFLAWPGRETDDGP